MNGPLRSPDEFVRHKALDLIGDLALVGRPLLGRVEAHKAGHALHTLLVSKLLADKTLWTETSSPGAEHPSTARVSAHEESSTVSAAD
jgi:UDP-3-O-[3-hydroxymyristoyl] N-acetylglucosamine deacetylase